MPIIGYHLFLIIGQRRFHIEEHEDRSNKGRLQDLADKILWRVISVYTVNMYYMFMSQCYCQQTFVDVHV